MYLVRAEVWKHNFMAACVGVLIENISHKFGHLATQQQRAGGMETDPPLAVLMLLPPLTAAADVAA